MLMLLFFFFLKGVEDAFYVEYLGGNVVDIGEQCTLSTIEVDIVDSL